MAKLRKIKRSPTYQLKRDAAAKDIKKDRKTFSLKGQKGAGLAATFTADEHKFFNKIRVGKKAYAYSKEKYGTRGR